MKKMSVLFVIAVLLSSGVLRADLKLGEIFTDHAVLQRGPATAVFGTADAGEAVTVSVATATANAVAGADGRWLLQLNLNDVGPGPHSMTVKGAKNEIVLQDILVGQVWLCSGQSNMQFGLASALGGRDEIAQVSNERLRTFNVSTVGVPEAATVLRGSGWLQTIPANGTRSAVGYYFARELQRELNEPVGYINSSWGGSRIEAWLQPETVATLSADARADWEKALDDLAQYPARLEQFQQDVAAWEKKYDRADRELTGMPADDAWKAANLNKLPGNGAGWLRAILELNEKDIAGNASFNLRSSGVPGKLYCNGQLVREHSLATIAANASTWGGIDKKYLQPGKNIIAYRYFQPAGDFRLRIEMRTATGVAKPEWEHSMEYTFADNAEAVKSYPKISTRPGAHRTPTYLYNGMIAPLKPYTLAGVIWYQGESNAGRAQWYLEHTEQLVSQWREHFKHSKLPFYWCQLANYMAKVDKPSPSCNWADLRGAQTAAQRIPYTGQAVLIDVGESGDIHPLDKETPGKRLAAMALNDVYGKTRPSRGPQAIGAALVDGKIAVSFEHLEGGLVARDLPAQYPIALVDNRFADLKRNAPGGTLEGFAVQGGDEQWQWADAVIVGDQVIVDASKITAPKALAYGWENNPTCNLYNQAGFPAVPFKLALP
ncbi:MAG: sialate O-acetylesterase [Lentisphaerae bacterium]|nr:sialate O-acetylesterase [Lentisphaerota bacterium]